MHRHVGDLGNITTDGNGRVTINIEDIIIQFYNSTQSIAGRTIIVHQMSDDGGGGGTGTSNTTGYDFMLFFKIF
jgi:Cu-Zn family superoxide dismutase